MEEVKDEFFLPLVEQIYEKLKKEDCILTEANRWRKPSEVLIGDEEIKKLIPNEDLQKFLGKEYISEKIKTKKSVLNKLGVRDFSIDDLIKCLEKIEWVKNQNWEWFVNLFSYLSKEKFSDEQLEQIKNLSIIKLEAGELTSINEGIVFFPLEEKVTYGFENEIRVIKKDIIEIILKQGNKEEILEFFRELGLKKADPYEIIENHILPVYKSEIWKQKDSRTLIGYIRYIKDNIDRYERESDKKLKANKTFWEEEDIKESLLIRINKNSEGKEWYDNPKNIYLPKIYGNENDLEKLFEGINVGFVHNCYLEQELKQIKREIADLRNKLKSKKWKKKHKKEVKKIKTQLKQLKKEKNKKIEKWKKFLLKIGVNEIPKVEHYEGQILYKDKYPTAEEREYSTSTCNVKDWRLSKEFNELLERSEPEKIKILLTILDHNWKNKYSKYIEMNYQWFYYNERNKTLQSSFIRDLKEKIKVLTTKNTLARPTEVFLNKHEICEILGDTVPYLAVEIKNEDFIKTLGINTEANIDCVLNYLKALVEQKSKDEKKFEELYKFLDEHFDDEEEGNKIKEEFNEETLIFVPDSEKKYYSAKEVIWKDVSNIFGKNRVYLEKYYPKFKKFFVEKLGINEKPIPKDYADVLCSISKKEKISNEDKEIIIRIYEELNRNLNPNEVENPMFEEEWWEDFIKKPIFFTNKGDFWSNDRDIFINDNELYYELFKDEENIAFLWLPENYHPDKIKFFIKYSGLRYLSKNIEIKPLIEETIKYSQDKNFTDRIRNILPYVLRYLYWRENEDYEKLKMEGILQRIGMIEVNLVENLRVEYLIKIDDIKTIVKKSEKRCVYCYDCDKLFLDKKDGSIYDLAIEFSKIFGAIKGLDNFVMHIMENFSSIEKIMEAKNIKELPSQEKEILKTIFENKGGLEKKEVYTEKPEEKIFNKEKKDSLISQKLVKEQIENHEEKDVLEKLSDITKIEKKWTPEISPEEVPINVEEYKGLEQEIVKKFKKEKQHLKKETEIIKPPTTAIFTESLSKEAKENIGYWGEEYAFKCIKNELIQKYPDAILVDTEEGFKLMENRNVIVEVIWLNKKEESGKHYDIKIVEKDKEIFVEVKSTKEHEKTWFQVSKDQWRIMIQKKDSFYIYRVYSAGTKEANIKKIQDPAKLWLEGQINAYPIGIEI